MSLEIGKGSLKLASSGLGGPLNLTSPDFDATALALFARFTTEASEARKKLINERIVAGKAMSFWAKLDALWVHAAHAAQAARLNWLTDNYNCVPINNPGFTVDRGYLGDGSSSYLDTGFNPTTAVASNYQQNSGSIGIRSETDNVGTGSLAGFYDIAVQRGTTINPRINVTNSVASFRINTGSIVANTPNGAVPSSLGMFVANRVSSAGVSGYRNGTKLVAGTEQPSVALANGSMRLGSINDSGFRACQFSMGFIGAGLTDQEVIDLFNWFEPYAVALGIGYVIP